MRSNNTEEIRPGTLVMLEHSGHSFFHELVLASETVAPHRLGSKITTLELPGTLWSSTLHLSLSDLEPIELPTRPEER